MITKQRLDEIKARHDWAKSTRATAAAGEGPVCIVVDDNDIPALIETLEMTAQIIRKLRNNDYDKWIDGAKLADKFLDEWGVE